MTSNPVPRPVPLPNRNKPPQNPNNGLLIGITVAAGILILILLFAMLRGCSGGAGDSGSGDGSGTQGTLDGDGSGGNSSDSDGTSNRENQGTEDEDKPERKAGSESAEETKMNSSAAEQPASEQSDTGEKQTQNKEEEKKSETDKETKTEEKSKDDEPKHSLAAKLSGEAANKDEPEEDKEETKQGGFLGKGDAEVLFFGAKGKGSKFVYVIDHSGSMSGSPLEEAKKEMLKGLDLLKPHHKFNVIFYDDKFVSWTNGKLFPATDKNKTGAKKFINGIQSEGGTVPEPALVQAVQEKPEHIFFLTDGEFSMNWEQMCDYANKNKVHINVIQFGSSFTPKSPLLQGLAKQTKGDYRFIDVGGLDSL